MTSSPEFEVVVIGAGFGGINAGVRLRQAGIENFVIVDKWDKVGGTWNANHYPGVAVDIRDALARLDLALKLYRRGRVRRLLLSGDGRSPFYDETAAMRDYLLSRGVPSDALLIDPAGLDTFAYSTPASAQAARKPSRRSSASSQSFGPQMCSSRRRPVPSRCRVASQAPCR